VIYYHEEKESQVFRPAHSLPSGWWDRFWYMEENGIVFTWLSNIKFLSTSPTHKPLWATESTIATEDEIRQLIRVIWQAKEIQ
jgi:hypothetical protein